MIQTLESLQWCQGFFGTLTKANNYCILSLSVSGCPCCRRWKTITNCKNFCFFLVCKPTLTWSITKPLTCIVANCHSFLACQIFKFIKYSPTFTSGFVIVTFRCPTCFYKPSNFGTSNLFLFLELQILHFTMDSLTLGPIIAFDQGNFVIQISQNILLSSHSTFLFYFLSLEQYG